MNLKTLYDYIVYVNEQWPDNVPRPARLEELRHAGWQAHYDGWDNFNPLQQLSTMKFIGLKTERDEVAEFFKLKPELVSWHAVINSCFDRDMRVPLEERVKYRNRTE